MKKIRLAIVSREGESLDAHVRFFKEHKVHLECASSFSELFCKLPDTLINGIIVDIPTLFKAAETEKYLFQSIEKAFPCIRTNWSQATGFRAIFYGGSSVYGEESMKAFWHKCCHFQARYLRREELKEITFNVLFWPAETTEEFSQRAFTLDISRNGLFVCT